MDYSEWRFDGESPIYIQLYHYLRCSILSGCMKPGEPLPSVRWLASLLHFNANTVARAYNPTSKDGLVEMSRGKAGRVTSNSTLIHAERQRAVKNLTGAAQQPDAQRPKHPSDFKRRIDNLGVSSDFALPDGIEYTAQKRRVDETILPTSYSDIKEYLVCPMGYKLKKLFGFNPAVPELFGFGLTTHTIIERLHQQYPTVAPTRQEVIDLVEATFHLKHIFPSNDPIHRPGPYERAYDSASEIAQNYVSSFAPDFERLREDEARFEITIGQAMVSGAIDLLLKRDEHGNIMDSHVIDFKSLDAPDDDTPNDWIDLSLQVQLYAYAADQVLGENTRTGSVYLLKEHGTDARVNIPVENDAVSAAISNIGWAVDRILDGDFPMRPCRGKCESCDVNRICPKVPQHFTSDIVPPPIHVPTGQGQVQIKAFSEFDK